MNRRLFVASLVVLAPATALAQSDHVTYDGGKIPDTKGIDPKTDPRVREVTTTLACNCGTCPHEPVSTCTCGVAARLRAEVAAFIADGQTPEQARASMIEKYGYGIVAKPPFGGLNLIAWIGPFVLIAAVAVLLLYKLKSWKQAGDAKAAAAAPATGVPDAAPSSDPYRERIEAELREGSGR